MAPFPIQYLPPDQNLQDLLFDIFDIPPDEYRVIRCDWGYFIIYRYGESWGSFQVIKEGEE